MFSSLDLLSGEPNAIEVSYRVQERRREQWKWTEAEPWKVALSIFENDKETALLFAESGLNPDDPFAWRAIFEALAQTFVRLKLPGTDDLRLAQDCNKVRVDVHGGEWHPFKVALYLKSQSPFLIRYSTVEFDTLRKRIRALESAIGPMDDGNALSRAFDLYLPSDAAPPELEAYFENEDE